MSEEDLKQDNSISIVQITNIQEICDILLKFSHLFVPTLVESIPDIFGYAKKLSEKAFVYVALYNDDIIGFTAFYANDYITQTAFGTLIAVLPDYQNRKIGQMFLTKIFNTAKEVGMTKMKLSVRKDNDKAIALYKKYGFEYLCDENDEFFFMIKDL